MTRPHRTKPRCAPRQILVLALPIWLWQIPSAAASPGDLEINLEVAPCVRVDAARVQRLFELELGTTRAGGDNPSSARVELDCVGQLVEIRVFDPLTGKSLRRLVDPGSAAGRDRLIALAVTELLVASWAELETRTAATARSPSTDTRAVSSARAIVRRRLPARAQSRDRTLFLATVGVQFSGPRLPELGVLVIRNTSSTLSWWADITAQFGSDDTTLGRVTNRSLGGSISLGPQTRGRIAGARATAHVTLGARARLVSLEGEPVDDRVRGSSVAGFAAGPMMALVAHVDFHERVAVAFAAELGWNVLAVRGFVDGRDEAGARGAWVTVRAGIGRSF